jgi:tRNA nucleotidyltransferase (CCA-adding enzyme)
VAIRILENIEKLARSRAVPCKALLVGSAARDTWLAGDHDLDIFIGMPEDNDLGAALDLAREIAPHHEEKYAEHAYVHANIEGFEVDLVPCYLVKDASRIVSAVDRTPFHTRYVSQRIPGLEGDVLLLKQFMKGIGVYGSELRIGGFSGYLSELLVLCYGSFVGVLNAAGKWRPGEMIEVPDQSHHEPQNTSIAGRVQEAWHNDPLVVIDPVDPKRNVAAALTLDKMFQFVAASRCFLRQHSDKLFFPPKIAPLKDEELLDLMDCRRSALVLIEFDAPPVVEDILFPQLRKAEQSIRGLLERNGFGVLRSDVAWHKVTSDVGDDGLARMLFELEVWELSQVKKHIGPPGWEAQHIDRFLSRHAKPLSGPYIQGGKVVVEIPRKYTNPRSLLISEMDQLSLGKHVKQQLHDGYKIYEGNELIQIEDMEFRRFMTAYFRKHMYIC